MSVKPPLNQLEIQDENQGTMELLLVIAVSIVFPPILLFGFFIVNPREEIVVLRFGKFVTTLRSQGIRWIHPVGRKTPPHFHQGHDARHCHHHGSRSEW